MSETAGDFERRFDAVVTEMKSAGIWRSNALPRCVRLLRSMRLRVRPPHHLNFGQVILSNALYFGVIWGIVMYLFQWRASEMTLTAMLSACFRAGVVFAIILTGVYQRGDRRDGLSDWEAL